MSGSYVTDRPETAERLVAKHETFWAAVAQANPHSYEMRSFLRAGWDPFWRRYMAAVARGLTSADVQPIIDDVNRLRANAEALEIPVPDLTDFYAVPPRVAAEYEGRRVTGPDGVARLAEGYHIAPGPQGLREAINHETDDRFFAAMNLPQDYKLDPADPIDAAMLPKWWAIRHAVVREMAHGQKVSGELPAAYAPPMSTDHDQVGNWFLAALALPAGAAGGYAYRKWQEGHPGQIVPWISGEGHHTDDPVWDQPKHALRVRGSHVAQHGHAHGSYLGVELFGPPGSGNDGYNVFPSLDAASDWLANEPGTVIYRAIYDATDPTWPAPISELFGHSAMDHHMSVSGDPDVGAYPWASIEDLDGPHFLQRGPWIDIVGEDVDTARMRAWPRTKALIKSAEHEVIDAHRVHPSAAYVWSLEWDGGTQIAPFATQAEALGYMRDRIQTDHVALALFDRSSSHWPNPVGWNKSALPESEGVIAQHVSKYAPGHAAISGEPWQSIVGTEPWQSIVGADPLGSALQDRLMHRADVAAAESVQKWGPGFWGVLTDDTTGYETTHFHTPGEAQAWYEHALRHKLMADDTQWRRPWLLAVIYDATGGAPVAQGWRFNSAVNQASVRGDIVGAALDLLRKQAKIAADELPARVIGVIRDGRGRWAIKQFRSADEADDWFGRVLREPTHFAYCAYFDKSDVTYPDPLNEQIGEAAAVDAPGAPIRRGIATAA